MITPPWEIDGAARARLSSSQCEGDVSAPLNVKQPSRLAKSHLSNIYFILFLGLLGVGISLYNDTNFLPILELSQMDKKDGVIEEVYSAGKVKSPYLTLRLNDGKAVRYLSDWNLQPKLKQLIGKSVTIWSQPLSYFVVTHDEDAVMQLRYNNKLILDYEGDLKKRMIQSSKESSVYYYLAWIFVIFMVIPSTIILIVFYYKLNSGGGR